jgi:alkylated DNA repair protein alkB homolog 8
MENTELHTVADCQVFEEVSVVLPENGCLDGQRTELALKKKEKEEKKVRALLEKKMNQGSSTIEKMEGKSILELVSKSPSQNVLFIYFGVGSANDCRDIELFLDNLGYKEKMLDIFPGFPHGFIEFESVENCQALLGKLKKFETDSILAYYMEINFTSKPKTAFFFNSKVTKSQLNSNHQNEMPNASSKAQIPGLTMIENFVTEEQERVIMEAIDKREWHKLATRRVQHDGYEFIYGQNNVNPNKKLGPLPDWIQEMQKNLESHTDKVNGSGVGLDQLTINDYNPGDGIPPHTDAISPFEEAFCAVSLLSGAVMAFKNPQDGRTVHIYFPPRSAMIFSGEGRLVWTHAIACRKLDRIDGKLVVVLLT